MEVESAERQGLTERFDNLGGGLSGTNLERAGDHNQRVTLQAIRVRGPVTRTELSEIVSLTPPAIANITKRLLQDGLILEAGRLHGARGQPAMQLAIDPDGAYSIGLNIDRDHITLVALDFLGRVRARTTKEIAFALPDDVAAFVRRQIGAIIKTGAVDPQRLVGIGVALPDALGGVHLPHRPAGYDVWDQIDVAALLADIIPQPVHIENDAAAAAMGELQFGHGLRTRNFVYILISAGLGGGLVIDGDYFRGARGRSGEIGFLPISTPRSSAGTLQEIVSLSALYAHLEAAGETVIRPSQLSKLDARGRAVVTDWLDLSAEVLCQPLLVLSYAIDPEAIFLGGRLPAELVEGLCARINARLQRSAGARTSAAPVSAVPVQGAALATDAAAMGAAILPFSDRFLPTRSALLKTAEA